MNNDSYNEKGELVEPRQEDFKKKDRIYKNQELRCHQTQENPDEAFEKLYSIMYLCHYNG